MVVRDLVALLGYEVDDASRVRAERSLERFQRKARTTVRNIGAIMASGAAAIGAGLAAIGQATVRTAADFEAMEARLVTLEGTSAKARESMEWLSDFAVKTPFEINELTDAFVKLKAYGIDPTDGTLRTLGDTASAMGKSLDQTVEAFADGLSFEWERLKEYGIRAKVAGDEVTFAWQTTSGQVTQTIKKDGDAIRDFLIGNMGRFSGAMDRQSKTFSGMMSNLRDQFTRFQLIIAEAGFFDFIKDKLSGLLDKLNEMAETKELEVWAKRISDALIQMAEVAWSIASGIGSALLYVTENWDSIRPVLIAMGIAFGVLLAVSFPIIAAIIAIGLVLQDLIVWLNGGDSAIGRFLESSAAFQAVKAFVLGLVDAVRALWGWLGDLLDAAKAWGAAAVQAARDAWDAFTAFLGAVMGLPGEIAAMFAALIASAVGWGMDLARGLLDGLKSMAGAVRDWFMGLLPDWVRGALAGGESAGRAAAAVGSGAPGPLGAASRAAGAFFADRANDNAARVANDRSAGRGGLTIQEGPVTVNQTVTQATDAPGRAVDGIGAARDSQRRNWGRAARIALPGAF